MRRLLWVAICVLGESCAKQGTGPSAPAADQHPPEIVAVAPAHRARSVTYDHPVIWAAFVADLDSATVTPLNVYLKLDTGRVPISVRWEAGTRRIVIDAQAQLELSRTYTVEVSRNVRTAEGVPLPQPFLWQFKTTSVHLPTAPIPADRSLEQSPFTSLSWGGNADFSGRRFEVIVAADSVDVADGSGAQVDAGQRQRLLIQFRWPGGTRFWWKVRVTDLATSETIDGPVWRFDTLDPASTLRDSIVVPLLEANHVRIRQIGNVIATEYNCSPRTLVSGPDTYTMAVSWNLSLSNPAMQLVDAAIVLWTAGAYGDSLTGQESIWAAGAAFTCRAMNWPGPPFALVGAGPLAVATVSSPRVLRYTGDALTIHLQATIQYPGQYFGYIFRSPRIIQYAGVLADGGAPAPSLVLYFKRSP